MLYMLKLFCYYIYFLEEIALYPKLDCKLHKKLPQSCNYISTDWLTEQTVLLYIPYRP